MDQALPELAAVPWRPRAGAASLARRGRLWTFFTTLHVVPFIAAAGVLLAIEPLSAPVAAVALAHAWIIPELYAFRGANVLNPKGSKDAGAERVAQGLLGDLLDHVPRELQRSTGLALEPAGLGVWVVADNGALLVAPGGRRVHCFCVGTSERELPRSDRIAHLLLALRTDEEGLATVANHAFAGAPWRLRRRLRKEFRPALAEAVAAAREL